MFFGGNIWLDCFLVFGMSDHFVLSIQIRLIFFSDVMNSLPALRNRRGEGFSAREY